MKRISVVVGGVACALLAAGCQTPAQFLDAMQPQAMKVVSSRAQFEMNCPQVTVTELNREVVQPVLQGPWVGGMPRGAYTFGVTGCGQRGVFSAICPQGGDGCFAVGNPNINRE